MKLAAKALALPVPPTEREEQVHRATSQPLGPEGKFRLDRGGTEVQVSGKNAWYGQFLT